jgi:O-antigen/teichoic acid export membrane protein
MNFLKKYKNFLSDMVLNMIGFGIYIVSQQIFLLPLLNKMVNDDVYSSFVLYISILNVICNVTGGELGNVRLVRDSDYKEKNIVGDFTRILVTFSPIITIVVLPIFIFYMKYSVIASIIFTLTILMANIRLYATCFYRLEKKFYKVIIQNICYLVGIIISLIVFYFYNSTCLLLFIPELISIFYAFKNSDILKMKMKKTVEIKNTIKKFFQLGIVSLLTNLMDYFDKFLIYPMFGATSVAVYYAVNSMSKIANLITNPMSSVILSWVSNTKEENTKNKILKTTLIANIPVLLLTVIFTVPLTYIALRILYNKYLEEALILIIPIALTTAFSVAATLIKSVLLKYSNTNKLVFTYFIYFAVFVVLSYILSKSNGLLGFTMANLISRILLWGLFVVLLIISKERGGNNEDFRKTKK